MDRLTVHSHSWDSFSTHFRHSEQHVIVEWLYLWLYFDHVPVTTSGVWDTRIFLCTLNEADWVAALYLIEADFQIEALNSTNLNEKGYKEFGKCFSGFSSHTTITSWRGVFLPCFCNNHPVVTPGTEASLSALVIWSIRAETREPPVCIWES